MTSHTILLLGLRMQWPTSSDSCGFYSRQDYSEDLLYLRWGAALHEVDQVAHEFTISCGSVQHFRTAPTDGSSDGRDLSQAPASRS